jgi:hypothetical protein
LRLDEFEMGVKLGREQGPPFCVERRFETGLPYVEKPGQAAKGKKVPQPIHRDDIYRGHIFAHQIRFVSFRASGSACRVRDGTLAQLHRGLQDKNAKFWYSRQVAAVSEQAAASRCLSRLPNNSVTPLISASVCRAEMKKRRRGWSFGTPI